MKLGDFDALLEKVQFRIPCDNAVAAIVNECVKITKYLIENAPAIDAVPVVRCKDCKHRNNHNVCPMMFMSGEVDWEKGTVHYTITSHASDNDFCSKGEKMNGDVNR